MKNSKTRNTKLPAGFKTQDALNEEYREDNITKTLRKVLAEQKAAKRGSA